MTKHVTVGRKGLITIPAEIRKQLGIKEGDWLVAEARDTQLVLKPMPKSESLG